jgi:hypothetical protein
VDHTTLRRQLENAPHSWLSVGREVALECGAGLDDLVAELLESIFAYFVALPNPERLRDRPLDRPRYS